MSVRSKRTRCFGNDPYARPEKSGKENCDEGTKGPYCQGLLVDGNQLGRDLKLAPVFLRLSSASIHSRLFWSPK